VTIGRPRFEIDDHLLAAGEERAARRAQRQVRLLTKAHPDEGVFHRRRHALE